LDCHFTGWFSLDIFSFLRVLDKEKKKLTDIGLFGFSWIGKWFFSVDIWIILINVC